MKDGLEGGRNESEGPETRGYSVIHIRGSRESELTDVSYDLFTYGFYSI